ncbi:MAG TPA: 5-formyltetrahydrofolate cyclo-ligase, partial [Lentisphaeria bacterium]|nr:5-formyltetrahydrofolate cyclo-ligase [Lentisphaeria bacterium]
MDKKSLRREYLKLRADIPPEKRNAADSAIARKVEELPEFRNAAVVTGYVTDGTEPDVLPIIRSALKKGRRACLPKWNGNEYILSFVDLADLDSLAPGKWGLLEPVSSRPLSGFIPAENVLYLVPGVAFDDKLNRLGRGGGIY